MNNTTSWARPFDVLRGKWQEVPSGGESRVVTGTLLDLPDDRLLEYWSRTHAAATTGPGFPVRGWYHTLYRDVFRGKRVMDVGSGMGIDGLAFARAGARMTFVDIVESNLAVLKRLCGLLGIADARFCYLRDLDSLRELPVDYDVIWAQGSLINAPFDATRVEIQELLRHLPVGGRWIELAYPKVRWEREGRLPFEKWGEKTDGVGTPWVEWYDLEKLTSALAPAKFGTVLYFNFHNDDFNWFDLVRQA